MPRQKTFNKTTVIQEAMLLFWKKGFHQTSVQELVQEIGINRASLYDTYHDKEGLFKESFNFYRTSVKNHIQDIFRNHTTIKAGFTEFMEYLIIDLLGDKNGCLITNSYAELLPAKNQNIKHVLEETREMWKQLIKDVLEKANKEDELIEKNINLEYMADAIYINIVGIAVLSKTEIHIKNLQYNLELIRDKILFK